MIEMAKNSFVIYHNYRETLEDLTDEQVGQLFRAILDYEIDKKEPNFNGELKIAFRFIKKDLDLNSDKYESICERNRMNGLKGGRPKNPKNPNGFSKTQDNPEKPKKADNDNDNEYEDDYDNKYEDDYLLESKKESKNKEINNNNNIHTHARESYDEIFEDFGVEPMLKETLIEFIRHCQLNKKMVTNDKLKGIIIHLDMAHKNVYDKIHSVQNAISGGYFDIIENKR